MISTLSHQELQRLDHDGFVVLEPTSLDCAQLKNVAQKLYQEKYFKSATIGASNTVKSNFSEIRNDFTLWIDLNDLPASLQNAETEILKNYCRFLEIVLADLKNYFRISLNSFETHFAVYPKGHFYKKHVDQTALNNKRHFSFVIYLNENWTQADGGRFLGYKDNQKSFDCLPLMGKMIIFLSSLEHEVSPANRERFSISGWFRND